MRKTFLEFYSIKETEENKITPAEVKLGDNTEFKPFVVDRELNSELRPVIKAFLDSGNYPMPGPDGWKSPMKVMDTAKGQAVTPKMKKRSLFLVGGAVRDHLLGKKPKDIDLATDAHPTEIELILRHGGFTKTEPQTSGAHSNDTKKEKLPTSANKAFFVKGDDRTTGEPFVYGIKVGDKTMELATFRKDSKGSDGRKPDKMELGGLEDDSKRRDFRMNSMYIPLTSADGPNGKLIDPNGGHHDIRNKEVNWIGDPKDRMEEDQLRALRYVRQVNSHGQNTKISDDVKNNIAKIKDLPAVSRERIREEFLKGLTHDDIDAVKYIKMYKDMGLLDTVFPGLKFKLDVPEDYSEKKEPRLAVAWLLRNNDPDKIKESLEKAKWSNDDIKRILHLLNLSKYLGSHKENSDLFLSKFYDMATQHQKFGMPPTFTKEWGKMNNLPENPTRVFAHHNLDTKGYVDAGDDRRKINPKIIELLGRTPVGKDFGDAIKHLETEKFKKALGGE